MKRLMIALLALPFLAVSPAWAGVRCVAFGLPACDTSVCTAGCYSSPQTAVAAAVDGDEIRIAEGAYTPPVTTTFTFDSQSYTTRQVVLVNNKSLILRGGYTASDFTACDPVANPTIVDGAHSGRGVTVIGPAAKTVAVSGLTIRNGDYSGLGNDVGESHLCPNYSETDCGGGLFAKWVKLFLDKVIISGNTTGNTAISGQGGGAVFWGLVSGSKVKDCVFQGNSSLGSVVAQGGGLFVIGGYNLAIENTVFVQNQTTNDGGGCYIHSPWGRVDMTKVDFYLNIATLGMGGGLGFRVTDSTYSPMLIYNRGNIYLNQARNLGASVLIEKHGASSNGVNLSNLLINQNSTVISNDTSCDVYAICYEGDFTASLDHCTAKKTGMRNFFYGVGSDTAGYDTAYVINSSILQDYQYGMQLSEAASGGQVVGNLRYTILDGVGTAINSLDGSPQLISLNNLTADSRLDVNSHPMFDSPARNMCPVSFVTDDYAGLRRDAWPDAGAYEYVAYRLQGPFELLLE